MALGQPGLVYLEDYRDNTGIEFLKKCSIKVEKVLDENS
jgi:hypothetical protein